jgi:hemin uptake protein HemP
MAERVVSFATEAMDGRGASTASGKARIESASLFQGKNEIIIVHKNEEYNLRITRNGKLILTK